MTGGGTGQDDTYSYYLREKDGEVLFDAYYRTYCDDGVFREVAIENAAVTQKDMESMRYWCNRWKLAEKKDNYEIPQQYQQEQPAEKERALIWKCAACGETGNKGMFCTECGEPVPAKLGDFILKLRDITVENRQKKYIIAQVEAIWENDAKFDAKMVFNDDDMGLIYLLSSFESITQRLGGCDYSVPKKPKAEGKIVSLEFSYAGGTAHASDYRYYLREENGEALFDALCYVEQPGCFGFDSHTKLTPEKAVALREDIDAVIEICGGNSTLAEQQKKYIAAKSSVYIVPPWRKIYDRLMERQMMDGPYHSQYFTLKWENGAELLTSPPDGRKLVLFNYLEMLAIRLALPPAEGDVVSFLFYGRDGIGNWDSYRYALYECKGEILFDAHYSVGYEKRQHIRVVAAHEDMEELQAICGKYAFAAAQQTYRPALPPDFDPEKREEKQTFIEVNWKNGAALNANTAFGGGDVLKTFFYDLAIRVV